MRQEIGEATAVSIANKAVGGGSAVTILGWLNSSNFGMWAGILIGVVGLLINWYYKHRGNARADEAHRAQLRALEAGVRLKDFKHEADE